MIQVITNSKSRISAFLGIIQNYTKYLISAFVIFVIDCFFNNQKSEIEWKLVIIWDLPRPLKFVFSKLSSFIFRDFPLSRYWVWKFWPSRFCSFEILTFEIFSFEIMLHMQMKQSFYEYSQAEIYHIVSQQKRSPLVNTEKHIKKRLRLSVLLCICNIRH